MNDGFAASLGGFSRRTGIRMDLVVRKVAIDVTADLVRSTPVDTGHARSNWFLGKERLTDTDIQASRTGASSMARATAFASNLKAGDTFFIVNNVAYIMPLEYGSSNQAPAGMARATVARWQQTVNAAVGSVR